MRFPPANGFAGSVVWQLAQSPASTMALPWAMVSGEGVDDCARASRQMNAVHKNGISRIARIAQCRDRTKGSLGRYTAKPKDKIEGMITPRHFAPGLSNDTNRNNRPLFRARSCDLSNAGLHCRDLWCAGRNNRHRLLLTVRTTR